MIHEMRRSDREITDAAEIDQILGAAKYATIALADGDEPYAVTLSCGYDRARNRLCFHTATSGRKLDIIARNPQACATVIRDKGYNVGKCEHPFDSVVLFGRMRVLEDAEDVRLAMRTLIGQLDAGALDEIWQRNEIDGEAALGRFKMLVFEIEELSAKSGQ